MKPGEQILSCPFWQYCVPWGFDVKCPNPRCKPVNKIVDINDYRRQQAQKQSEVKTCTN